MEVGRWNERGRRAAMHLQTLVIPMKPKNARLWLEAKYYGREKMHERSSQF